MEAAGDFSRVRVARTEPALTMPDIARLSCPECAAVAHRPLTASLQILPSRTQQMIAGASRRKGWIDLTREFKPLRPFCLCMNLAAVCCRRNPPLPDGGVAGVGAGGVFQSHAPNDAPAVHSCQSRWRTGGAKPHHGADSFLISAPHQPHLPGFREMSTTCCSKG